MDEAVAPGRCRGHARAIWRDAVDAVKGDRAVRRELARERVDEVAWVLAVGKAAGAMLDGCAERLAHGARALVLTKYGHYRGRAQLPAGVRVEVLESGHPTPDANSLAAGERAVQFVRSVPPGEELLMLVSGGASALVECPAGDFSLDDLAAVNRALVAGACDIHRINQVRTRMSRIKGGQLLGHFGGRRVRVYALSDVPGDDIRVIGSGIGAPAPVAPGPPGVGETHAPEWAPPSVRAILRRAPPPAGGPGLARDRYLGRVIAGNRTARAQARQSARALGYPVRVNEESLGGDIEDAARMIGEHLRRGEPGVYIWGGEPVIDLPAEPGRGGRNQHLALLVAREIRGLAHTVVLAAGSDGNDGPTAAAGGLVDGGTFRDSAHAALAAADAGSWLERHDALFTTGPTGANVMDLVVGVRGA